MTKARDLAGFASSSVTTTASDGLVLKGDGSSTDVVIKNGANATVATVADGTTTLAATANLTAGGSITATGASVGALAQGAIQVGNSSGVAAPLTIGSSAQLLQSNGTTAAWATISTGTPEVVFPNLASPNNTYTSGGTWSKGSLSDDDYVWFYLVSGGRGGFSDSYPSTSQGGYGGAALLVYGQAAHFDGAAYLIGAGGVGGNSGGAGGYPGATKLTTTTSQGSIEYKPYDTTWNDTSATDIPNKIMLSVPTSIVNQTTTLASGRTKTPYDFIFAANSEPTGWAGAETTGNLYAWSRASSAGSGLYATNGIFGGGGGGGRIQYGGNSFIQPPGGSLYAGAGGTHSSGAGAVPGGGGAGNSASGQAGAGGAGNMRVYHV